MLMVTIQTVRQLALSFPETDEAPHHEVIAFRVKKKIFATLNAPFNRACVRLSEIDQSVFCSFAGGAFYPVPNRWGSKYGWTLVDLEKVDPEMFQDGLIAAYCFLAPKKLAAKYTGEEEV